ncbi:MAG: element excision factor XisH family protein [Saprospiraceae bacterium]
MKSFLRASIVNEFHRAIGQYLMYRVGLLGQEPDRLLFLAIPAKIMEEIEDLDLLRNALSAYNVNAVIFDPVNCRIKAWIKT